MLASLPKGEAFKNDGQPYVRLPTLRAVKQTGGNSARSVSRTSVSESGR